MMKGAEVGVWMVRSEAQIPIPGLSIMMGGAGAGAGAGLWIIQSEAQIPPSCIFQLWIWKKKGEEDQKQHVL